jgi:hypothetical protein
MLEEAGSTRLKVDFKADVSIDSIAFFVVTDFVKPNVATLDTLKESLDEFGGSDIQQVLWDIDAPLDPGQLTPGRVDEAEDLLAVDYPVQEVWVIVVKMKHHCSILVDTSTPEGFIQGRIDASKRNWPRRNKTTAIVSSSGS